MLLSFSEITVSFGENNELLIELKNPRPIPPDIFFSLISDESYVIFLAIVKSTVIDTTKLSLLLINIV